MRTKDGKRNGLETTSRPGRHVATRSRNGSLRGANDRLTTPAAAPMVSSETYDLTSIALRTESWEHDEILITTVVDPLTRRIVEIDVQRAQRISNGEGSAERQ